MELKIVSPKYGEFIVLYDDEDHGKILKHTWGISKYGNNFYAKTMIGEKNKQKILYLHRFILNAKYGDIIDHKDNNTLNNKKSNIRFCSHQNNMMNRKPEKNSSSKFKGIYYNKNSNLWHSQIYKNFKKIHLGYFENEIDAALAYNGAAKYLFGKYAYLNKI